MSSRSRSALLVRALVLALSAGGGAAQVQKPLPSASAPPTGGPTVAADLSDLRVTPSTLAFGAVNEGDVRVLPLTLRNTG